MLISVDHYITSATSCYQHHAELFEYLCHSRISLHTRLRSKQMVQCYQRLRQQRHYFEPVRCCRPVAFHSKCLWFVACILFKHYIVAVPMCFHTTLTHQRQSHVNIWTRNHLSGKAHLRQAFDKWRNHQYCRYILRTYVTWYLYFVGLEARALNSQRRKTFLTHIFYVGATFAQSIYKNLDWTMTHALTSVEHNLATLLHRIICSQESHRCSCSSYIHFFCTFIAQRIEHSIGIIAFCHIARIYLTTRQCTDY